MDQVVTGETSLEPTKSLVRSTCGGYDYHFVASLSEGSDLVCKICHLPSQIPHLSGCCGHTFCKSCIDSLKERTVNNACPVCRDGEFPVVQNKQINRAVRSLRVYCTNEKEGCKWQGEINDLVGHLSSCQFENVECENSGCGIIMKRQLLRNHMLEDCLYRDVECYYCHLTGSHVFIKDKHKDECPKFPLPCPNRCGNETVFRQDLDKHREICPLEMVNCEYYDMGCDAKMARKDVIDHNRENIEEHLQIVKCELVKTKKDLAQALKGAAAAGKKLVSMQKKFQEQATEKKLVDLQSKFQQQISDAEALGQANIKKLETQFYNSMCQLHKNCNPWTLKLNAL